MKTSGGELYMKKFLNLTLFQGRFTVVVG